MNLKEMQYELQEMQNELQEDNAQETKQVLQESVFGG